MLPHYFDDNCDNSHKLYTEINSWIGTPYQHGGWVKGVSVDCLHFIGLVYKETGIITDLVAPEAYPIDWYLQGQEKVVELVDLHLHQFPGIGMRYTEFTLAEYYPRLGDLLFLKMAKTKVITHVGIKLGKNLWVHANSKAKRVTIESIETYLNKIEKIYKFELVGEEE